MLDLIVYIIHCSRLYILAVCVDDFILVGKQGLFILNFKTDISSCFLIEDLGLVSWLLGCKIDRDRPNHIIRISHGQYITYISEEFNMSIASIAGIPMAAKPSKGSSKNELIDKKVFLLCQAHRKATLLLELYETRHHDGRQPSEPLYDFCYGSPYWEQAKRALRYLLGALQHSLIFNGKLPSHLLMR